MGKAPTPPTRSRTQVMPISMGVVVVVVVTVVVVVVVSAVAAVEMVVSCDGISMASILKNCQSLVSVGTNHQPMTTFHHCPPPLPPIPHPPIPPSAQRAADQE